MDQPNKAQRTKALQRLFVANTTASLKTLCAQHGVKYKNKAQAITELAEFDFLITPNLAAVVAPSPSVHTDFSVKY